MKRSLPFLPRLIRLRDAPSYLGMDRNKFNAQVRPYLTEIPLGKQAVAFDRLEIDAWIEDYIGRNGRPGPQRGDHIWDAKEQPDSYNVRESGISTNMSEANAFAKALENATSPKPKTISRGGSKKSGKRSSSE